MNALLVAGAIEQARPERIGLFTLGGRTWEEVRPRAKQAAHWIRQAGFAWQWAYHVEPNPSGSGDHHVHWVQHGDHVPVRVVRAAAERAGLGSWVGIHRIRSEHRAGYYGLKLAAEAYGVKLATAGDESLRVYLAANGGRMVHTSRGFWRDASGRRIAGIRGAVQNACRVAFGSDGRRWVLERRETAGRRSRLDRSVELASWELGAVRMEGRSSGPAGVV